ncbi:hypothetical protein [Amycolatopsis benzoatilytica]|uniref:hypothetical protein n=1 Tax=Amycolatopsis benzoatilytica TaxID=346045 RepID=UPI00039C9FAB|nr:hypothetical protein [Amycolatopsis benzoatilytica]
MPSLATQLGWLPALCAKSELTHRDMATSPRADAMRRCQAGNPDGKIVLTFG